MTVDSLFADVSDGRGFFSGTVTDLSRFGLCMTDLPAKLDHTSQRLSVVISGSRQELQDAGQTVLESKRLPVGNGSGSRS